MVLEIQKSVLVPLALAAGLAVSAAALDTPASPAVPTEAPRVTAEELKALVAKGQAVIVDVRARDAWAAAHIAGAVHIPLAELATRLKELPKGKNIVAYCT
jgi:3-mercaptopyruvate sulfurtransferase SseA